MPFKPGQSGNPGGRPKENEEVKRLALQHCPSAIKRLVKLTNDKSGRTAVAACVALLDRGLGKPSQAVEHSGWIAKTHEEALAELEGDTPTQQDDDDNAA